jgi:chemotaxis protein MotA
MLLIVGFILVTASVLGGYVLAQGELAVLWQPFELVIIGGAAVGAFIASNPMSVIKKVGSGVTGLLHESPYNQVYYMDLLALLHDLFVKWRKEGLMAIEADIEDPHGSEVFERFPRILMDKRASEFICDYLRICASGNMSPFELENLMDMEIETLAKDLQEPAHALQRVGEGLPGFGIVAAVLGIIITMKALGGPPELIGYKVAAALVGTFIGILLAYGFVNPMGTLMAHHAEEEAKQYECIKACIMAMVNGIPPQLAVEFGRKTLMNSVRPGFSELEDRVRGG